jgi:hypothetical protein
MSLTPLLREKLRGLKAEEEERALIMKEIQRGGNNVVTLLTNLVMNLKFNEAL